MEFVQVTRPRPVVIECKLGQCTVPTYACCCTVSFLYVFLYLLSQDAFLASKIQPRQASELLKSLDMAFVHERSGCLSRLCIAILRTLHLYLPLTNHFHLKRIKSDAGALLALICEASTGTALPDSSM